MEWGVELGREKSREEGCERDGALKRERHPGPEEQTLNPPARWFLALSPPVLVFRAGPHLWSM